MPNSFFRVEMLPALHGDCLFVEYGDSSRSRRLLIDGGPIGAYDALEARINALPKGDRRIELVVMTHVDTDHAEGLVRLFANKPLPIYVQDVWFNGWKHLNEAQGLLGGNQGEFLSALLVRRLSEEQWNGAFKGKAVAVNEDDPLPEITLEGGMKLTLLSPTTAILDKMRQEWKDDMSPGMKPGDLDAAWKKLGTRKVYLPGKGLLGSTPELDALLEKQFKVDQSVANGSSIAFLAEFGDKSCLFLADAHHKVIIASLERLLKHRGLKKLNVSAVKVAHHGSAGNICDDLLSLFESPRFLFSTNGAIFNHPDKEAVERIVTRSCYQPPTLYFNYLTETTKCWQDIKLQEKLNYRVEFNSSCNKPLVINL
jgi:hypothetical protein